ncbi:PAN-3 domain-containing protein [Caenorhabditis elegans]|uniref:PAN-3 domain-containing protein n=1 Tax=Caenorhabditis elegans TaxID=6239 RepID=Q19900_CAEEL|nr:PAN-3 domain-containing protein [Caenorhabditis elegans]CAB00094.4 PAN-3 domain-containing protein [Caenorhabditis elegans]
MMVVYGETDEYNNHSEIQENWDNCLVKCYWDDDCLVVQKVNDRCRLFSFGSLTINRLDSSSQSILAFKRNETNDTCPAKSFQLTFESSSSEWIDEKGFIYNLTFTSFNNQWIFDYTVTRCPDNSALWTRNTSKGIFHVCVETRLFPNNTNNVYEEAHNLCMEPNGMGLTAPFDSTELKSFIATKKDLFAAGQNNGALDSTMWIDGRSYESKNYIYDDISHVGTASYLFGGNEPDGVGPNYCLFLEYNNGIGDKLCKDLGSSYGRGAFCRVRPIPV